ncbi:MAG: prepilin-type N-terminal cleavage/methylation domain-containing protein [Armatimonadetes bacterium]|nr:prepilin-type N-terminal cleavage/methylation domain-containing protein [Armatimonadota bacterium]
MPRRRAFTLIEILVVIAIIAVLAGIVFPVFFQAKEAARKDTCLSNLKQVAAATLLYCSASDDTFPLAQTDGPDQRFWGDLVQPYVKDWGVLRCPSEALPFATVPLGLHSSSWNYHYALNDVRSDDDLPLGAAAAAGSTVTRPTETVLFVDGWPLNADPGDGNDADRHVVNWVWGERDSSHRPTDDGNPRHQGRFSIAFCDGHVAVRARGKNADGTFQKGTLDIEWVCDGSR